MTEIMTVEILVPWGTFIAMFVWLVAATIAEFSQFNSTGLKVYQNPKWVSPLLIALSVPAFWWAYATALLFILIASPVWIPVWLIRRHRERNDQ